MPSAERGSVIVSVGARALRFGSVVAMIATLSPLPLAAHEIFVTNEKDNTVSVIDSTKLEVVRTIPTGHRPRGVAISKDGKTLFVCAGDSNEVQACVDILLDVISDFPFAQAADRVCATQAEGFALHEHVTGPLSVERQAHLDVAAQILGAAHRSSQQRVARAGLRGGGGQGQPGPPCGGCGCGPPCGG